MLIGFNVCVCTLMILLGFLQQRRCADRYSVAAACLMCADALASILLYAWTDFFPAAAFGLAAILFIHGAVVHFPLYESADPLRSCPAFRTRCVCNHETWVLVALAAGAVSAFRI
jgi:hypothetical protein